VKKTLVAACVAAFVLAACGSDGGSSSTTTKATTKSTTTTSTSTTVVGLEQPAIWPAADTYFATPDAAAKDFVSKAMGVPPELGTFKEGDSRSGEMPVLSHGVVRGTLLMRQLGSRSGWFVTAAVNDNQTVSSPEARVTVPAGNVTVSGKGRGFEALVVIRAFVAGNATELSKATAHGGSMETPEPYSVTLDLSKAKTGDTVMILVRGGTGLETDPGDFSAIPVVVG
jgi:hypothetical protein